MNYSKIYSDFIADRRIKEPALKHSKQYVEKHHILPRSKGGDNSRSNIVSLSMEDHIHAHILLGKIYGGTMWGAAILMTKASVGRTRSLKRLPTKPEILAAAFARKMFSIHCRGENHSQYGRSHTESAREQMSAAHRARGEKGLIWSQQNKNLISGINHWTKQPRNSAALEAALPIFRANLLKAVIANTGAGNPMHRPDVAAKVGAAIKGHWINGTGMASESARRKRAESHNTPDYLAGARARVLGEKNHNFGLAGGKNYNSRRILCVETGVIFNSVKDAVAFCGGDVTKAARTGGKAGGYSWSRLDAHAADGRIMKKSAQKTYGESKKET